MHVLNPGQEESIKLLPKEGSDKVALPPILFNLYLKDAIRQWQLGQGMHLTQDKASTLLFAHEQVLLWPQAKEQFLTLDS
jgi:hypothetical protein